MNSLSPVSADLTQRGVPHRVFRHPGPVRSLEQAARERGQSPDQVVRSILFRVSEGEYLMVLVAGPEQISWAALRKHLGQSRLTMASREEVLAATGYETGAVAPFGLSSPMRVLVDESVRRQTEVSIGSGVRGTTIIIRVSDLLDALSDLEVGDFKVSQD